MNLQEQIIEIAKEAGNIMTAAKRPKIMEKSGHANFCTETDEKVQRFLIEKLTEVLPEAEFLGEEDGQDVFTAKMSISPASHAKTTVLHGTVVLQ